MSRGRRMPSAVLTDQVAGHALGEILQAGRVGKLPEIRPSLKPCLLIRYRQGAIFKPALRSIQKRTRKTPPF